MATVVTKKDGFREINGLDSNHFGESTNEAGHTIRGAGMIGSSSTSWGSAGARTTARRTGRTRASPPSRP